MADYLLLPVCARSVLCGGREQDVVRPLAEHGLEEMERAVPGVQGVAPPLLATQHPCGAVVMETGLPKPVPVHEVLVPLLPPGTQSWLHDLVEGNFKATYMDTCTHTDTHTHTHTYTHTHTHTRIYIYTHTHTHTHTQTHTHTYTHTHTCTQTQVIPSLLSVTTNCCPYFCQIGKVIFMTVLKA